MHLSPMSPLRPPVWVLQVTGVLARRGYNVQSLAVGPSEVEGQSRITTVIPGSPEATAKLVKQRGPTIKCRACVPGSERGGNSEAQWLLLSPAVSVCWCQDLNYDGEAATSA